MTDIIVADASPIIIATHTNLLLHLQSIVGRVIIPPKVAEECLKPLKNDSMAIKEAIEQNILTVSARVEHDFLSCIPHGIDAGEAEAIALALSLNARLLIDDRKGRKIAKHEGLHILGFGAILVKVKKAGIIPTVLPIIQHMHAMHYHISDRVVEEILMLCGEC